jgi:hypothetical protein
LQAARRQAQLWEREAVLRASTVAGTLAMRVLAGRRLAAALERSLRAGCGDVVAPAREVHDALLFYREIERDRAG